MHAADPQNQPPTASSPDSPSNEPVIHTTAVDGSMLRARIVQQDAERPGCLIDVAAAGEAMGGSRARRGGEGGVEPPFEDGDSALPHSLTAVNLAELPRAPARPHLAQGGGVSAGRHGPAGTPDGDEAYREAALWLYENSHGSTQRDAGGGEGCLGRLKRHSNPISIRL